MAELRSTKNLNFQVSYYIGGRRVGPCWQFKIGGGVLAGNVDGSGRLTGSDVTYAYPDFETLLVSIL
jgi:hypothetical protein